MKITIKNFKQARFASEETRCFEASIYIDSVSAGTVRNDGHGGPNLYHPWALKDRLDAYARTLPPVDAYGTTFEMDADLLVDELINDMLLRKNFDRTLSTSVMLLDERGKLVQSTKIPKAEVMREAQRMAVQRPAARVLNLMDPVEAFDLYKRMVTRR
jgi:hypothetical protein